MGSRGTKMGIWPRPPQNRQDIVPGRPLHQEQGAAVTIEPSDGGAP